MRLLLIDDSETFRLKLIRLLRESLPDAEVVQWAPTTRGKPANNFDWKRFDTLLLSVSPAGEDGLEWLRDFRRAGEIPPTLVLADSTSGELTARAIEAGASGCLSRTGLTADRLVGAIRAALLDVVHTEKAGETHVRTQPLDVHSIGNPPGKHEVLVKGYRMLRRIGEGGMAKVYLAEREKDNLQLVLKVLESNLLQDEQFLRRFLRECDVISRIRNEHVVAIHDHGVSDDCAFLAMEYFPGGNLKQRIRAGLPPLLVLKFLMQIATALDAVHSAGVVHRDMKPQNIMFRDGNRLALVDFGLAKEIDSNTTLTRTGMVLATPLYMSPEQCMGKPQDRRGDLYSLGVILYEMLTGALPYHAANAPGLAHQHLHSPVPRLPPQSAGFQPVLDRLMAKKPEERFQSARELFTYVAR
ncbi:MAG: protein kinase [Burkholderiales bacterium]